MSYWKLSSFQEMAGTKFSELLCSHTYFIANEICSTVFLLNVYFFCRDVRLITKHVNSRPQESDGCNSCHSLLPGNSVSKITNLDGRMSIPLSASNQVIIRKNSTGIQGYSVVNESYFD